jgi:hypothetical protein
MTKYAAVLLKGGIKELPSYVQNDVKKVGAPRVYGVLRYLSRYAGDQGVTEDVTRAAYRKFENNNKVCIRRTCQYVDQLCVLASRHPSIWQKALDYLYTPNDEILDAIKDIPVHELSSLYRLCSNGYLSNKEFIVLPYDEDTKSKCEGNTLLERLSRYIIAGAPEVDTREKKSILVPKSSDVARKYGLATTEVTGPDIVKTLLPLSFDNFICHVPSAYGCGVTMSPVIESIVVDERILDIVQNNKHYRYANGLTIIFATFMALLFYRYDSDNEAFTDFTHVHNLFDLYTASKRIHRNDGRVKKLYREVMNECAYSGPTLDTHGKYETLDTIAKRYDWITHEAENDHKVSLKAKYRKCKLMDVPKALGQVRTITPCSIKMQSDTHYPSIALKYALQSVNPRSYSFYDQEAQVDRLCHHYLTVDASSASDLVDVFQVVACAAALEPVQTYTVNTPIYYDLLYYRPYICYSDTNVIFLAMYGCMGHNLTYPCQTMVFRCGIEVTLPGVDSMFIGDDGTVEPCVGAKEGIIKAYRIYGWKLSEDKSFLDYGTNGECVGAFRWTSDDSVTTICDYITFPRGKSSLCNKKNVVSMIAHQHSLFLNGYTQAAEYLGSCLLDLGITASTSLSPYEVWSNDAVATFADGAVWNTGIEILYPASADEALANQMLADLTNRAPGRIPKTYRLGFNGIPFQRVKVTSRDSTHFFDNLWVEDDPIFIDTDLRDDEHSHGTNTRAWFNSEGFRLVHKPIEYVYDALYLEEYVDLKH